MSTEFFGALLPACLKIYLDKIGYTNLEVYTLFEKKKGESP